MEAIEEFIEGSGGKLFTRAWRPSGQPKAVVAICHGFNAHGGLYQDVGEQLAAQGFAAYALDLRGRGRSEGERFYVESFADYVADLDALVSLARSREPGCAIFLLGHSAGGVTGCLYALEHQAELAGLICEDFAFEVPAPDFALAVIKAISHLAPHAHSLSLKNVDFSRDPQMVRQLEDDPLIAHESQPFATMAAIVRADERLKQEFPLITLPLFIIHGAADIVAKPSGSEHFHERAGSPDKTLKLYDGAFHDPLHDLGKEQVLADIVQWIEARLP